MRVLQLIASSLVAVSIGSTSSSPSRSQEAPHVSESTPVAGLQDDGPPHVTASSSGVAVFAANPQATPAMRYGLLSPPACEAELVRRHIAHTRVSEARGVSAPIRLTGTLHGVTFHSALPLAQRSTTPYEIVDCRLALALDDFATILAKFDIVEVIHMSVYRPPPARGWIRSRLGKQHEGALAIDAGTFVKRDGTTLHVERDFYGSVGASTCGPGTGPSQSTPEALTLRSVVCEAADAHLFNVLLTPDFNWQHRNHVHLEVTPSARWFLVH